MLETLLAINGISQNNHLNFGQKLQQILLEILKCINAKSGSIMLMKGPRHLEVAASTRPEIIGVKQLVSGESPSAWVVQNRAPLRVDNISKDSFFEKKYDHYRGTAFLLAPIIVGEKIIGVLNVTDKIGTDMFSAEEQEALITIAGQVISALENQRLAETLKKKGRTLQKKNTALRKLEKLKTELYNMLIHDLKGPISEVIANLDILTYTLKDENLEFVRAAQSGCDTLYSMVCNLLDISRYEEDKLDLIYERIDPRDILKESISRIFGLAKSKDLTLKKLEPDALSSEFFWGDRDKLLRVLQNLLNNAIQYSPHGQTIEAGFRDPDSRKIEFYVKDDGPGIPPKYHETVFDKFHQLEKKADGRIYTTGLGLTFCKMAVEAHQGKIQVISDGVHGSTFSFFIPIEPKHRGRRGK